MDNEANILLLIERARTGESVAQEKLIAEFEDEIRVQVRRLVGQNNVSIAVDDVVQEVCFAIFRGIKSVRASTLVTFRAWLKRITRNCFITMLRKRKLAPISLLTQGEFDSSNSVFGIQLEDLGLGPSSNVERDEAIATINEKLSDLPKDQADVIRYCCIQCLSVDEAAEKMGRSPGSVRGLLHRAKVSLKLAMGRTSKWFYKK